MNQSTQGTSVLRQRMIEDMRLRKLATQTQSGYIRAVRHFAGWLGRSPALSPLRAKPRVLKSP